MTRTACISNQTAEGVRVGDPEALGEVYRVLAGPLIAWLRTTVRDPQRAEDLAQDTFLELVRDCRRLTGGPSEIRGWLYRAAHHNLLDDARARARRPERPTAAPPDRPSAAPSPAESAVVADAAARLSKKLADLAPDQSRVLRLRFWEDLSAPEVAARVGRTEGAVRALQHRAVTALGKSRADAVAR